MRKMKKSSLYPGHGKRVLREIDNNIVCKNNIPRPVVKGPRIRRDVFVPVSDYKNYLEDMTINEQRRYDSDERLLEMSMNNIENIRKRHVDYYKKYSPDVVMEERQTRFKYNIESTTTNGVAPFLILKERYGNSSIPIKEKIKALNALGAPREYLINEMVKHEENLKWKVGAEKVLKRVFSKFSASSKSKAKKKSLYSSMIKSFKGLDMSETD